MLRPFTTRVSFSRFLGKSRDLVVNFGTTWSRMLCTAEKTSDDATRGGTETESFDGELSELEQKIKLIKEKDGIINDLEVFKEIKFFGYCHSKKVL